MFIRVKRRKRSQGRGATLLYYAVESVRDDAGRPRQRNVAYLGSSSERPGDVERLRFLQAAEERLAKTEELDQQQRRYLYNKLDEKVPKGPYKPDSVAPELREQFFGRDRS